MRVLSKNIKKLLITMIFVLMIMGIKNVFSTTQLTFNFDIENPVFRYYENALNDTSTTKDIIFNSSQNFTEYIKIPRNATILFSNMNLTGQLTPTQTYGTGVIGYYSVAVGNVTQGSKNDVVIGTGDAKVILLDSSLNQIWNFTASDRINSVTIGNLKSDSGDEIIAGSQDTYVYLLNSTGNQIWSYSTGSPINAVVTGDVTSDTGNEIAVGSDKLYVLNSTGNLLWDYTTAATVYSVAMGDLNLDGNNEIIVGDNNRTYLINSTGSQIWNYTIGGIVYGLSTGDVTSDTGNEIAAGGNKTVYVINSSGNLKWTYYIGDTIYAVSVGDITSDPRDEITVGSNDYKVYALNSTGQFIWSYTTGNKVQAVAMGEITTDSLNETAAVSLDAHVYILNFDNYPTNAYLDIGNDGGTDWIYPTKLRTSVNVDNASISSAIQNYLNLCSSVSCDVPLVFHSDAAGDLRISNINITYDYNASHAISHQILYNTWSRTNDTQANESIGNAVKNISYGNLANNIQFNIIRINDSANACDYDRVHYTTNTTINGVNYCNVTSSITSYNSSFFWDNMMSSSVAVYMNESSPITESAFWKKNVTIWNATTTVFYNVIANATLNDTLINSNESLRVYWNNSWCDLTPASTQADCDSAAPTTQKSCGADTFYVCMKDTNSNNVEDYFKWKQPSTSIAIYELSGSINHESNLTNANVDPSTGIWDSEFNFTVNVSDYEGDNVTVNLWVYIPTLDSWVMMESKNTTQNTATPETLLFTVNSNKSWTGTAKYRFEYRDFNETGFIYHPFEYTENFTNPTVQKHNTSIIYVNGNDTAINRTGGNVLFLVLVNDTNNATIVQEGVDCTFWITTNGVNFDSGHSNFTNSSGHCNYTFDPDSSYSAGIQQWKAGVYSDTYYQDANSTTFNITVYGQLNINLTQSVVGRNFTRGQSVRLEAKIYDEFSNTVSQSDYNCTWYVNTTIIGNSTTNSTGYCNYTWTTDCSKYLGLYPINVSLWNSTFSYYIIAKNESNATTTLKDTLNVTITNPLNGSIVYELGNMILNSTLSDSCGVPTESYTVGWYFSKYYSCPEFNPVVTGPNTSWNLNASCTPRQHTLIANATGNLYYDGKYNVSILIHGWANVEIEDPTTGDTINRSQLASVGGLAYYDVVCKVKNNYSSDTPQYYPVKFWYNENSIGENSTNNTGQAKYRWNITSNETVPEGSYNIKCNITNNSTLYYNASIAQSTATNVIIIGSSDAHPPQFVWVHANSVQLYNNVTIEANITDIYGIDKVWISITNSSWSQTFSMYNTSTSITRVVWNYSLNLTLGDYDYIIYANDTSNNTNSSSGWFEVHLPILYYGYTKDAQNQNVSIDFIFYRNGTDYIIHNFSTSSSNSFYNQTVHNRTYDIDIRAFNHTVKFVSVSMAQDSENSVKNISTFTATVDDILGVRNYLKGLMIESTLNYSYVNLTLNYSDVIGIYTAPAYPYKFREIDLDIYKCGNFSITGATWNCSGSGGWTNLNVNPNLTAHTITSNMSTLSGFILGDTANPNDGSCDRGEKCPYDITCCGATTVETTVSGGGGGGGGSTGISPKCGNGKCEAGENSENCPVDCGKQEGLFSVRTNLTNVQLDPGQNQNYALWVTNNGNYKINVSVSMIGAASDFVQFDKTKLDIQPQTEQIDKIYITIPGGTEPGTYTGTLYVTGEGTTQSVPILIGVSMKGAISLEVYVEALNKLVGLNETAKFRIIVNKYGPGEVETDFRYLIKEFDTEKEVYENKESKNIERFQQFVKNIPISEINIKPGHYLFEVELTYHNTTVSAADDFNIVTTFWTSTHIFQISLIIAVGTSIVSVLYGRKRYIAWKVSKARYIFPVDMRKLPKGALWLGKIAETSEKAYYNMNDLTTHILTAGATGSGKSVSASVFVEELLEQKIPIVVFDPTAQWTGFVRPCRDQNLIKYYKEFGLNANDSRPYTGMIYEVTDPNVKIDFKKYMNPGEITVFTLNKLRPGEYDVAVTNIIDTIFTQNWEESTKVRLVIVFDEVHRLLEKYGGKGGYIALERACREFRKWGIGLIMASQVLSDFKEAIKGNVLTEIQLHTKSLGDLVRIEKKYGLEYAKKVTREEVGVGMMQNPKYNEGRPWFIAFRPTLHSPHKIPDEEMNMYREYTALLVDIESKIETMEKAGQDVFDLKMELKLAKDKLRKGRFRMAKIYIDSLTNHIMKGE